MAGLKEIRTRIGTVKTTRQVTSAMKMVSAAKLKKAQDAIIQIRPYADRLYRILGTLSSSLENSEESVFTQPREAGKVLIVVVSSNRGLCGSFNSSITRKAVELAQTRYPFQLQNRKVEFLAIGKMAGRQLKHARVHVSRIITDIYDDLTFDNVSRLSAELMEIYLQGKYDCIELVYNQFKNAAVQIQTTEKFLPVEIQPVIDKQKGNFNFIFEPSQDYIIKELIPRSLKIQFYKALLDSNAAEQGARMTAMHQATDNATELLRELTLQYNKARQATITREILEITSGAEALKG